MTFTAYDTGSSGFNIAVAVGKALKDKHGSDVRVLPAGNDVARLAPLKANRAQVSAMGIGTYFAQESVFEFAVKDWGPQPLRLVLSVTDCNAVSLGVAKDTGVKEVKDLKGKRVGMVVGSPALNQNAFAVLAFGDLTRNDVKLVEFSGYGAMWKGMVNNEVDAAIASTISGQVKEVETSPRGIVYPPTPAADKEGWARVNKIGPYYYPHKTTCGAGIPQGGSVELPSYPYPIFMVYASQPADLVYSLAKAMIVSYDAYKDAAPGAAGLAVDRAEPDMGDPLSRGDREGAQGSRRLEGRARGAQPGSAQAPGHAGRGLGRLSQDQPARRQGRLHEGLDGRAQGCARQGRHGSDLRIAGGMRGGLPAA